MSHILGINLTMNFSVCYPGFSVFLGNDLKRFKTYDTTAITLPESEFLFSNSDPMSFSFFVLHLLSGTSHQSTGIKTAKHPPVFSPSLLTTRFCLFLGASRAQAERCHQRQPVSLYVIAGINPQLPGKTKGKPSPQLVST